MNNITELLKSKKTLFLIFAFVLGIALVFCFGSPSDDAQMSESSQSPEEDDYAAALEEKLERLIGDVSGVGGEVGVAVTLESGRTEEFAYDNSENITEAATETSSTIVLKTTSGGVSEPVVATTRLPEVKGVAVVCKTADEKVKNEIVRLVSSLLQIGKNKIYVTN